MAEYAIQNMGYFIGVYVGTTSIEPWYIKRLEWTEDIEQVVMTGSITFVDVNDMIKNLTGFETITIQFDIVDSITPKNELKTLTFMTYDVILQPGSQTETGYNIITMKFIEKLYLPLCMVKYNYSWSDTSVSDMVNDILMKPTLVNTNLINGKETVYLQDSKDVTDVMEETEGVWPSYVMQNQTAIECIKYLMRRSRGASSKEAGFLFYSSNCGLNFTSVKNLINLDSLETVEDNTFEAVYRAKPFGNMNNLDRFRILQHTVSYPKLQSMMKLVGSVTMGSSCVSSGKDQHIALYSKITKQFGAMGQYATIPNISGMGNVTFTGDSNGDFLKNIGEHDLCREYIKQHAVEIKVFGWPDQRKAGMKVNIEWQDNAAGKEDVFKPLSGEYLVKTIRHEWGSDNKSNYTQSMLLLTIAYNGQVNTLKV